MADAVLMTGTRGLLATHLRAGLESGGVAILPIDRGATAQDYAAALGRADAVVHLAGVTASPDPEDFEAGNVGTTVALADAMRTAARPLPVLYASSIRVAADTLYGRTKRDAEAILVRLNAEIGAPLAIFRLPSFFGTWSRPDYNSAIATFCHQVSTGVPIVTKTPDAMLELVELDDAVQAFDDAIARQAPGVVYPPVLPTHHISVGEAARVIGMIGAGKPDDPAIEPTLMSALRRTYEAHRARR